MFNKPQNQSVDQGGTAIQAAGDVQIINAGLSYSDVKQVALDVFRENFYHLSRSAAETVTQRVEEITEAFLAKLQKENPSGIQKANDPSFQSALYTVQKEHAKNGDKNLGELLVNLLVDRSKQEQRSFIQIVLNESLETAPKLTNEQLATLSLIFFFKYTQAYPASLQELQKSLRMFAIPFSEHASASHSSLQHLEYAGCGSVSVNGVDIFGSIAHQYHGLFQKGFTHEEVAAKNLSPIGRTFLRTSLSDPGKLELFALNRDELLKAMDARAITQGDREKILQMSTARQMTIEEIKARCIELVPQLKDLSDLWIKCGMGNFQLTSVGIAIAHANFKRTHGTFPDLAIWVK